MKKHSGGDLVVSALEAEGVPFAFGIPGTHNIELYDALGRAHGVRPVLVTDEQAASFMADGAFRASGKLCCVNVVPGAGLTHALSGVAEAYLDQVPMLVLGCGIRRDTGKAYQLHDVDQQAIARPVTKAQFLPRDGTQLYEAVREACVIARTPPYGPVFVEVPAELYFLRSEAELHDPPPLPEPAAPATADLARAVDVLGRARRVLLYVGRGAAGAASGLVELAERLQSPVATTIQGKGVFPESHPLWAWCGFGPAVPAPLRGVIASCDATLAIGCRFAEVGTASYGGAPPGVLVHADVDPSVLGRNYAAAVTLRADARRLVELLLEAVPPRPEDPELRAALRTAHAKVRAELLRPGRNGRVGPGPLMHACQKRLGPDAVYATDSGNGTFLAMEILRLDGPGRLLAPVDFSCMGYAVPAAIGAALACPDRPVVAFAGDGALLMTGLELMTAAQLELGLTVIVLRDRELAQIAQFQKTALARKTASGLPDYDLEALARAVGCDYLAMPDEAAMPAVLDEAFARARDHRPVVVESAIDYSRKTAFTRGVVRTNFGRLPWSERLRFVARALGRRVSRRVSG